MGKRLKILWAIGILLKYTYIYRVVYLPLAFLQHHFHRFYAFLTYNLPASSLKWSLHPHLQLPSSLLASSLTCGLQPHMQPWVSIVASSFGVVASIAYLTIEVRSSSITPNPAVYFCKSVSVFRSKKAGDFSEIFNEVQRRNCRLWM